MRGNCDLDLRLSPSSFSLSSEPASSFLHHSRRRPMGKELSNGSPENQKITIFYNGMICVSDVTELQGKEILLLATNEMEEKSKGEPLGSEPNSPNSQSHPSNPPNHSLCMRRSLQTFLQKRKNRIQSASPYHHR